MNVFRFIFVNCCIGLRYFNVFGQRQNPTGDYAAAIPRFILKLLNDEPITIYGDGSNSRDFTYIENVIQANMPALFATSPGAVNTVYNVACGQKITLNEVLTLIRTKLNVLEYPTNSAVVEYKKERDGDIPHSLAAIEKAELLLNYHPTYDIDKGLDESIVWYIQTFKIS